MVALRRLPLGIAVALDAVAVYAASRVEFTLGILGALVAMALGTALIFYAKGMTPLVTAGLAITSGGFFLLFGLLGQVPIIGTILAIGIVLAMVMF